MFFIYEEPFRFWRGKEMIDKLKFLLDVCEDKPKIKKLLLNVAKMPEDKQEDTLKMIEILLGVL